MERPIFTLIDKSERPETFTTEGIDIIESTIDLSGKTLHFSIRVQEGPAKLTDIVPLARAIWDKIGAALLDNLAASNQSVQCGKGCSACCSYLVALSLPEACYLQQTFASIPAECRIPIIHDCIDSAQKILDPAVLEKYNMNNSNDMTEISKWYTELDLRCPFLSGRSCSIYAQRPLACREHLVTTPPELCKTSEPQIPEIVPIPVSMLEVLGQLTAELEQTDVEAVILPLAVTCMDHYMPHSYCTWPAVDMVKHFVRILESLAAQHMKAVAIPG